MRSRYSAYVLQLRDYLLKSWHPDTRPASLELDASTKWLGLKVIRQSISGDDAATVEFVARLRSGGNPAQRLHEVSRFVRVAGHWYYLDGEFPEGDAR